MTKPRCDHLHHHADGTTSSAMRFVDHADAFVCTRCGKVDPA